MKVRGKSTYMAPALRGGGWVPHTAPAAHSITGRLQTARCGELLHGPFLGSPAWPHMETLLPHLRTNYPSPRPAATTLAPHKMVSESPRAPFTQTLPKHVPWGGQCAHQSGKPWPSGSFSLALFAVRTPGPSRSRDVSSGGNPDHTAQ